MTFVNYRKGSVANPSPTGSASLPINNTLRSLLDRTDGPTRPLVVSSGGTEDRGWAANTGFDLAGQAASGVTSVMCRLQVGLPYGAQHIQIGFGNWLVDPATTPLDGAAGPLTVKASVEDPITGGLYPCMVNGTRTLSIDGGGPGHFDPVPVTVAAAGSVVIRYYVQFAGGARVATNFAPANFVNTVLGVETNGTDKTLAGTVGTVDPLPNTLQFLPLYLLGQPLAAQPYKSVFIIGDSISPPINAALAGIVPKHYVGFPAQTLGQASSHAMGFRMRGAAYCTHAICQLGINDVRAAQVSTLADIQARAERVWSYLQTCGNRVIAATITPYIPTWVSDGSQTPSALESVRVAYNDWIRSKPLGIVSVLDWADVCETSRNSGVWKAGSTTDGTHPIANSATQIAMKSAVTTSLLV